MRLKEIKPGMAIHCKTGLEAEKLFSVLRNCGIKWLSGDDLMSTFFYEHADTGTCYFIDSENKLSRSSFEYFTNNTGKYGEIIPFSSLIIEEKTYEDGLNDAWECAKKISLESFSYQGALTDEELKEAFGTFDLEKIMTNNVMAVIAKLEAYEAENQIKVGDVVNVINNDSYNSETGIFLGEDYKHYWVMFHGYSVPQSLGVSRYKLKKTGKNIDISSILSEIGKE